MVLQLRMIQIHSGSNLAWELCIVAYLCSFSKCRVSGVDSSLIVHLYKWTVAFSVTLFYSCLFLDVSLQFMVLPFLLSVQTHSHHLRLELRFILWPSIWTLKISLAFLVSSIHVMWPIQFSLLTLTRVTMSTCWIKVCGSWLCLIRHWPLLRRSSRIISCQMPSSAHRYLRWGPMLLLHTGWQI